MPGGRGRLGCSLVIPGKRKKKCCRGGGHRAEPVIFRAASGSDNARGGARTQSGPGAGLGDPRRARSPLQAAHSPAESGGSPRRKRWFAPRPPHPRPVRPLLTLQTAGSGQAEGEDSQREAVAPPPPARQRPHEQAPRAAGPALASRAARRGAARPRLCAHVAAAAAPGRPPARSSSSAASCLSCEARCR